MKKPIKTTLKVLVLGVLVLVTLVNVLTPGAPPVPEADLAMAVPLEDGTVITLGELIGRELEAEAAPEAATKEKRSKPTRDDPIAVLRLGEPKGVFGHGLRRLAQGRPDLALRMWRAIPEGHPDYARAQRFIGYKIYDRALGDPAQGVAYVNRSLWKDPLSGNAWQDAVRIYWHTAVDAFD